MHYGDEEQLSKNILEVVIYKHQDLTSKKLKAIYQLTSIQNCKYIHPIALRKYLNNPIIAPIKKQLEDQPFEKYYSITLKETINGLELINIINVSKRRKAIYFVH